MTQNSSDARTKALIQKWKCVKGIEGQEKELPELKKFGQ